MLLQIVVPWQRGKASGAVVFNGVDVATNGKRSQVRFPVQDHMGW